RIFFIFVITEKFAKFGLFVTFRKSTFFIDNWTGFKNTLFKGTSTGYLFIKAFKNFTIIAKTVDEVELRTDGSNRNDISHDCITHFSTNLATRSTFEIIFHMNHGVKSNLGITNQFPR